MALSAAAAAAAAAALAAAGGCACVSRPGPWPLPEQQPRPPACPAAIGWWRTRVGGGKLRWMPTEGEPQISAELPLLPADAAAGELLLLLGARQALTRAAQACPLAPIATTHRGGVGPHQLVELRLVGGTKPASETAANALAVLRPITAALAARDPDAAAASPAVARARALLESWCRAYEVLVAAPPPPPMSRFAESCRTELVLCYCAARHPLAQAVQDVVLAGWAEEAAAAGGGGASARLSTLHTLARQGARVPLCPAVHAAVKLVSDSGGGGAPDAWRAGFASGKRRQRQVQAYRASAPYRAFLDCYRRWVAEVVVPLVGDPLGVVFQCPPTLRVVLPCAGGRANIGPHKDSSYPGHEPSEINFWVPMTPVSGSNTLWLESRPGKGDYRPMELGPGQALRFNGMQCMHHTLPNRTAATRVSFDLRVIPRSFWRDEYCRRMGDYDVEVAV